MARDECCYLCNECPNSFATLDELESHMTADHVTMKKSNPNLNNNHSTTQEDGESFIKIEVDGSEEEIKMEVDMNEIEEHIAGHSPTSSDSSNISDGDENSSTIGATPPLFIGARIVGHSCRICGRAFTDRGQLNVHYTHTHRDKPQYECEHCQAVFCVKRELSTHLRIHSGEQPHKCDICAKEFGTRQLLKKHNMWHSGERSHVCSTCGKAFFQKGHLTQHLMIHKGGRNHRCTQCEKTFIFKFDLNRHMKIHLERGHSCTKCGKSFLKQISLDEHSAKCKRTTTGTPSSRTSTPLSDISRQESPTPDPMSRRMSNASIQIPISQHQQQLSASPFQNAAVTNSPSENAPAPSSLPLFNNPFFASQFSTEDQGKIAQNLMAHYQIDAAAQQRLLMMKILSMNQQNLTNQLQQQQHQQQQQQPSSLGHFCTLCNKQFPNTAAYALHLNIMHMKNGGISQQQIDEERHELKLNVGQKAEEMLNLHHSDTATSSSCASSPQKVSPVSTTGTENKFCGQCDQYREKNGDLSRQVGDLQRQLQQAQEQHTSMMDAIRNLQAFFAQSVSTPHQNSLADVGKLLALHCNN